jgi:hypothetical protein
MATDIVLDKMIETNTPLTLENYIRFAFLGNPPEGIEKDAEFLSEVPDQILRKRRSKKRK